MSVLPGSVGPLVSLQDARRDVWNARAKSVLAEIERRRAANVPLDDSTDWGKLSLTIDEAKAAAAKRDSPIARARLLDALSVVSGGLSPMGDYVPDQRLDGVMVRLRKVPKRLLAEVEGAISEIALASMSLPRESMRQRMLADVDAQEAQARLVAEAVAELHLPSAGPFSGPLDAAALEAIEDEGLLSDLYVVAREYQSLRPTERQRFGESLPSTSATSIAASAPQTSAPSEAVTGQPPALTSKAPAASPMSALGESYFAIPLSPTSSSSTGVPTEGSAAQT